MLACDQRIRWWAGQLREAGLDGGMDELRARAFLDLVPGKDSRPRQDGAAAPAASPADSGGAGGFAGQVTLTVPLVTLLDLDQRPGEIPGIGPIDPRLARDLARAAAQNPATTWATDPRDHRFQARGHDPGVKLRHLSQVRHATCTSPICRRPGWNCDFEHNTPCQAGGRTCLCNGGPKCKR